MKGRFRRMRVLYGLLLMFLLTGFLHVVLYGIDFFEGIVQIFSASVLTLWSLTLVKRITDRKIRHLFLGISVLLVVSLVLQFCKYKMFGGLTAWERHTWYAFYIPMASIPVMFFQIAVRIDQLTKLRKNSGHRQQFLSILTTVLAVLLVVGIITNDLHQLAFSFPDGVHSNNGVSGTYHWGPLFYLYVVEIAVFFIAGLLLIIRSSRLQVMQKQIWIPVAAVSFGFLLVFLCAVGIQPRIMGVKVWQVNDSYCYTIAMFLEACIAVGLIPANSDYEKLFRLMDLPVRIEDREKVIFSGEKMTAAGETMTASGKIMTAAGETVSSSCEVSEDLEFFSQKIFGGTVFWTVDMAEIHKLNRELSEYTERIRQRNEYLKTQNEIKGERASLDTRNGLYDRIASIVEPQLLLISRILLEEIPLNFDRGLAKINILNAYIKRRSNMELLKEDNDSLTLTELLTAMRESADYLNLFGVDAVISGNVSSEVSADLLILSYEFFEHTVEQCLESLKAMAVVMTFRNGELMVRLMIQADVFEIESGFKSEALNRYHGKVTITKQESDMVISLLLSDGKEGVIG